MHAAFIWRCFDVGVRTRIHFIIFEHIANKNSPNNCFNCDGTYFIQKQKKLNKLTRYYLACVVRWTPSCPGNPLKRKKGKGEKKVKKPQTNNINRKKRGYFPYEILPPRNSFEDKPFIRSRQAPFKKIFGQSR